MIKINETVKKGTHLSFQGRRSSEEVLPAGEMGKVAVIKSIHSRGKRGRGKCGACTAHLENQEWAC